MFSKEERKETEPSAMETSQVSPMISQGDNSPSISNYNSKFSPLISEMSKSYASLNKIGTLAGVTDDTIYGH